DSQGIFPRAKLLGRSTCPALELLDTSNGSCEVASLMKPKLGYPEIAAVVTRLCFAWFGCGIVMIAVSALVGCRQVPNENAKPVAGILPESPFLGYTISANLQN